MKQAEKFGRPIITFIDTPGAYPGIEAEEHGQGEAIARSLLEMSQLKVPVIAIVIGEGGSGGALALAVADEDLDAGICRFFHWLRRRASLRSCGRMLRGYRKPAK